MINEFGVRLYSARKMAGMSMAALAEKAGAIVSKQAISKYEKGQINPGNKVLIALSKALGVKVDYFFRPSKISISRLEFRKRSQLTKKVEEQIKYLSLDFLQKHLEIEDILNVQEPFVNPVSKPLVKNHGDIERAARERKDKWKLGNGPVPHLIELLENGWRREEPGKYEGKEVANRFKQLVYHGMAEQIISFSKAADFFE